MKIENLNLKKSIIKTLIEVKKFKEYTPIQEKNNSFSNKR